MHKCQFCSKTLATKSSLNNHQKTAKYCLKIQKKNAEREYRCPGCDKAFQKKGNFDRHESSCGAIDTLVERKNLREQVVSLENKLADAERRVEYFLTQLDKKDAVIKELAQQAIDRPTTQNNNKQTINKQTINLAPFNLNEAKARAIFDANYDETYFLDGPKGLAKFVNKLVLKTNDGETIYACFDRSRNVFKYKDEDGQYIKDIKAKKLIEIIYPAAVEHGSALAAKFMAEFSLLVEDVDDHDVIETARIRSDMATDAFLSTRRLRDEPEPFTRELAALA